VDVDRHLDVGEDAVGQLEEHEQRVLQLAPAAAPAGVKTCAATISWPNSQRSSSISWMAVSAIDMSRV
jgi:hypothetical protein